LRKKKPKLYIVTDQAQLVNRPFAAQTDGVLDDLRSLHDVEIGAAAFYVNFSRAELVLPILKRIVACGGLFVPAPWFGKRPFHAVSAKAIDTYNECGRRLGTMPSGGLEVHSQLCQAVELTATIPGDFIEYGVFSGSSSLTALTHMRNLGIRRRCWLLDTYSGFTYEAALNSPDAIWAGTHVRSQGASMARIRQLMGSTDQEVRVVANEVCSDSLPPEVKTVALANVDVDLYEAVGAALWKLASVMAPRGIIVVEDPTSVPGLYGAYLAMVEFMESPAGRNFIAVRTTTQYFLIRVDK
jgi:hypothetical protein